MLRRPKVGIAFYEVDKVAGSKQQSLVLWGWETEEGRKARAGPSPAVVEQVIFTAESVP